MRHFVEFFSVLYHLLKQINIKVGELVGSHGGECGGCLLGCSVEDVYWRFRGAYVTRTMSKHF